MNESSMKKLKRRGKAVNSSIEFVPKGSDSTMNSNSSNPHTQLSNEKLHLNMLLDLLSIIDSKVFNECSELITQRCDNNKINETD